MLGGSCSATAEPRHLRAAIDHTHGVVLAQREVDGKIHEITAFARLLDAVDLADAVVIPDDPHTRRAHADHLVLELSALSGTVKGNQPSLHAQLKPLPWKTFQSRTPATTAPTGASKRAIKIVTVSAGIPLPHVRLAIQTTRKTCRLDNAAWTTEIDAPSPA